MNSRKIEDVELDDELLDEPKKVNHELDTADSDKENEDLYEDDLGLDEFGGDIQTPMDKHADLLKELTNFNPYLKDAVNGWLGLVWSETENKTIPSPDLKPIMNSKCAGWCVSFLKNYARKNNIITHIGKYEYRFIVEDIIDAIWLNIGLRYEEFGICNNGDILRICTELQHAAELILMGAGDGKYNAMLSTVTQRTENISSSQRPSPETVKQQIGNYEKIKNFLMDK